MKPWIPLVIGAGMCVFVLWPIFIAVPARRMKLKQAKPHRELAGCIPVRDGKVFLINGRNKHKLLLPRGGIDNGELGYYAAGKEALEEAGLIGKVDTKPIVREGNVDWYILEVTKVLEDWKERHERLRQEMSVEDILLHSEVRAITKVVIKAAIKAESKKKQPRLSAPKNIFSDHAESPFTSILNK